MEDSIIEIILKVAGVVDAVFFLAYSLDALISWIRDRRNNGKK